MGIDAEAKQALPFMVISQNDFDHDYQKSCRHISDCTAPLICGSGRCAIPPSLLGSAVPDTPKLRFSSASGDYEIQIETASDDYSTQRGMMMRRRFAEGWGMLFIFPGETKHSFWMHSTYIPLDMVFIRADGSVSNVHENAAPLDDGPRYPSTDRVKYVLELPQGSIKKYSIASGTSRFDISAYKSYADNFSSGHRFDGR